jgi:hypothetical protein
MVVNGPRPPEGRRRRGRSSVRSVEGARRHSRLSLPPPAHRRETDSKGERTSQSSMSAGERRSQERYLLGLARARRSTWRRRESFWGWLRAEGGKGQSAAGRREVKRCHATKIFQSSSAPHPPPGHSLTVVLMLVSNHKSGQTLLGREVLAPCMAKSKTSFTGVTQVTFVSAQLLGLLKPWSAVLRSGWEACKNSAREGAVSETRVSRVVRHKPSQSEDAPVFLRDERT